MSILISQADASDVFDVPTEVLYVCDGKRVCGKPSCTDHSRHDVCHHTSDISHALYDMHFMNDFERHPSVRGSEAVIICVEPIRG